MHQLPRAAIVSYVPQMIIISQYFFNFLKNNSVTVQLQDSQRKLDYDQINTLKKKYADKCVTRRNDIGDALYPQKLNISKFKK